MALFRKRPVVIEAITFDELVAYGLKDEEIICPRCKMDHQERGQLAHEITCACGHEFLVASVRANIHDGVPWSFTYQGHAITYENDDCYLIPTSEGTINMTRADRLITGVKGEIYPCKIDIFEATYDPA